MNKLFFLFIFLGSLIASAQNTTLKVFKFGDDSIVLKADFFVNKTFSFDFSKQEKPFSIYNPKPGFNTVSIISRNYYSFENTNSLLSYEMRNLEKEPIYPEVKKETLGEAIFSGIIDAIFQ